MSVQQLKQKWK